MIEKRIAQLEDKVKDLERQVHNLNAQLSNYGESDIPKPSPFPDSPEAVEETEAMAPLGQGVSTSRIMFLLGRSTLILAGGFLLRAMTESGSIPPVAGFALGMVYSLGLIYFAFRILGKMDHLGASSIGLTAALVAYPFLTESITKLNLISPVPGGLALSLVTAAGLWTSWHHRQRFLSWVFCLSSLVTILGLGFTTEEPAFFALLMLILGAVTTLFAYTRRWHLKRWVVGMATNLIFFRLTVMAANRASSGSGDDNLSASTMLALDLGLLVIYLGFFCYRALIQGKGVRVFDIVQSAMVLAIGFGGATHIANSTGQGAGALGWTALFAALSFYTVSFTTVRTRLGRGRGFFYFASLALIFLFLGSQVVAQGPWLSWVWLVLGLVMALLGSRFDRVTLRYHSIICLVLASIHTGLLASSVDAFIGPASKPWHPLNSASVLNLVVAMVCYLVFIARKINHTESRYRRAPDVLVAVLSLMGLGYLTIFQTTRILTEAPPEAVPAVVAVVRTAVLSLTAVALAMACKRPRMRELSWLVYPLLGLGCVKLLLEDLRQGTPLTLFVAFGFFGAALILAPRLVAKHRKSVQSEL